MGRTKNSANNTVNSSQELLSLQKVESKYKGKPSYRYRVFLGKVSKPIINKNIYVSLKEKDFCKAIEAMNRIEEVLANDIKNKVLDTTFEKYKQRKIYEGYFVKTYQEYLDTLEELYFQKKQRTDKSKEYFKWVMYVLKNICKDHLEKKLTTSNLEQILLKSEYGTAKRQNSIKGLRLIIECNKGLKKFLKESDFNISEYSKGRQSEIIREVPSDELIWEGYRIITQHVPKRCGKGGAYSLKAWGWVYGMLATYGLRPHELTRLELDKCFKDDLNTIYVGKDTKTGARTVFPLYPQWVEDFHLREVHSEISEEILEIVNSTNPRGSKPISSTINKRFKYKGIGFVPYDLRHAYAVRGYKHCFEAGLMADSMGHSLQMHHKVYRRFADEEDRKNAFKLAINKAGIVNPYDNVEEFNESNQDTDHLLNKIELLESDNKSLRNILSRERKAS